ncbi:MAG: hypothetical protein HY270_13505 [Deltaproteobacteria bacterium]|nr:hypothetical protein [Deltaproteobacteria bacterium]
MDDLIRLSIDRREVSDLFQASSSITTETRRLLGGFGHVYSWTGFGDPTFAARLAEVSGASPNLYPFRGLRPHEHASDYYARCIGALATAPIDRIIAIDRSWVNEFVAGHGLDAAPWLILHPGSGSARKNWLGFGDLIRAWRAQSNWRTVTLVGPAENDVKLGADISIANISLPRVAALLSASSGYVGNDSGISHLAGAVGASGVVLFGSSDPITWAPRGGRLSILQAPAICDRCGSDRFCAHRLTVESVLRTLSKHT